MKRNLLYLLAICCLTAAANAKSSTQKYFSPNQKFFAMVYSTQKSGEMPECIVSIYDTQGKLLQYKSYVSPDHEHGYSVVQLKWSADSKFCVWSLTSSGGHSPWHFPTDCFVQKCNTIVNIDAQLNCGLTQAKFKLQSPHMFLSQCLIPNPAGEPDFAKVTLNLADLKCH